MDKDTIISVLLIVVIVSLPVGCILFMVADLNSRTGIISGKVIKVVHMDSPFFKATDITFEHVDTMRFSLYYYPFEYGKNYTIYYKGAFPFYIITNIDSS